MEEGLDFGRTEMALMPEPMAYVDGVVVAVVVDMKFEDDNQYTERPAHRRRQHCHTCLLGSHYPAVQF